MVTPEEKDESARKEKMETQEKHAEIMRALWRHENDLMNTRLNSFVTMQAILFAGLGVALQNKLGVIIDTICALGVIVSISTAAVFSMGFEATTNLDSWWNDNLSKYAGPGITGSKPAESKKNWWIRIKSWCTPGSLLPKVFLLAWGTLTYFLFHFHYFTGLSR